MTDTISIDHGARVAADTFESCWHDGSSAFIRMFDLADGRTWLVGSYHSQTTSDGSRMFVPITEVVDHQIREHVWKDCGRLVNRAANVADLRIAQRQHEQEC